MGGVDIIVIMGRDASFVALASAFAKNGIPGDGPHLIYPCERTFNEEQFIADIDAALRYAKRHFRRDGIVVVVSEGLRTVELNEKGKDVLYFEKLAERFNLPKEYDDYGNLRMDDNALAVGFKHLVKKKLTKAGEYPRA